MGRGDRGHAGGAFWRWFPVVVVLAILAGAGAAYRFDLGARWLGTGAPDPATNPAAVAPPEALTLPPLASPRPVADPLTGTGTGTGTGTVARGKVRRALAPLLDDPDLGRDVFAVVGDLSGGAPVFDVGEGAAIPASTTKLLTTTAALQVLGPDHVFETKVVRAGAGRIVLVGGGDPFLARKPAPAGTWPERADVVGLAGATAEALEKQGRSRVTLGYDDSLFSGPPVNSHWRPGYVPDGVVSPITALWVDEGRSETGFGRVADPAATAEAEFVTALRRFDIRVTGRPRPLEASPNARELAVVDSAPLSQIVEQVLSVSDNEAAEVLARHVGLATSGVGSSAAGAAGVVRTLRGLGVSIAGARVYDGSGLSRENRLDPDTLIDVLRLAASSDHPELRASLTGLPVAGFNGSLEFRFDDAVAPGRGRVRAKTGTLTGVSALAGLATDLDGSTMVFVLVADRVRLPDTLDAREAVDDLAAALGACHCST